MDEILPGRRLLGTSLPKEHSINMLSGILVGGVAAVMMLVFLFALCTCKDSKKEQGRSGNAPKSMNENRSDVVRSIIESEHMTVDFETGIIPLSNGIPAVNSRTSDLFNSSRPTSIDGSGLPNGRQLPSPPGKLNNNPLPDVVDHPSNGFLTNSRISCHGPCQEDEEEDEDDPYDHLGQPKAPGTNDDDDDDEDDAYDHVGKATNIVKKSGCITITQADFNNYGSEQLYASVDGEDDNTYASLKISGKKRAPISSVVSPSESTTFRDVSYSIVPGEDLDDPYSKISGESSSSKPDVEDPYASVDTSRNGATAGTTTAASISVPEPTSPLCASPVDGQPRIVEDDYAIVNKPRRSTSPVNLPVIEPIESPDLQIPPPEPPRAYIDEDLESNNSAPEENLEGAVGGGLPVEAVLQPVKVEPPYTKVTARESLASINARQRLLNMYETVPETENMYATVDGGSGDGVVVRRANRPENPPKRSSQVSETYAEIGATGGHPEAAPVPPSLDSLRTVTKQNPHGGDFRRSGTDFIPIIAEIQHDYAVVNKRRTFPIDFSQAHYDVPSSRNMPQLAMSAQRGLILVDPSEQPTSSSHSLTLNHPKSSKNNNNNNLMSKSLTGKLPDCSMADSPSTSKETPSTSSRSSIVTSPKLEPEYQVMRDGGGSENDSEYDPNYETVEDAQRKAAALRQNKARRRHDYEEVDASQLQQSPTSPPANPAEEVRERVLRQHTYEDVREVRKQHKAFRRSQEPQ